jgi:predicted enzyme related to lactoylglutathione lyase
MAVVGEREGPLWGACYRSPTFEFRVSHADCIGQSSARLGRSTRWPGLLTIIQSHFLSLYDLVGLTTFFWKNSMRVRTIYFKVTDMEQSVTFWEKLLELSPNRKSGKWTEFSVGDVRLGMLLNDFGDELVGSACVPVFEFDVSSSHTFVNRAKALGATVVLELNDDMNSIVLASPDGQEFEVCTCHD